MFKSFAIALSMLLGFAGSASANIPRYRAPGARLNPLQNVYHISQVSAYGQTSFSDSFTVGAQAKFANGASPLSINTPPLNTAYFGGSDRKLVAQFACSGGTEAAIEVGVTKGVVPSNSINAWALVDGNASPGQAYTGYYIRYTTAGLQYQISLPSVPVPGQGAGVAHQVRVYRVNGNQWNVNIYDVAIGQQILNTTLGAATCNNAAGQPYNPIYVHKAYAGAEINSSDPAITPSNTIDNTFFRFEDFGLWFANPTLNRFLPKGQAVNNAGWLGVSPIVGYIYNPANNGAINRLFGWGSSNTPDPNITPVPVSSPVPCGPGTSIPLCPPPGP